MPLLKVERYTRAEIRANRHRLYVFGDNLNGAGFGGQAKEARGEPNAVGVPTKVKPSMAPDAFFADAHYPLASERIGNAFRRINAHLMGGGVVVWPKAGIGTGLAELETRAPSIWRYLQVCIAGMEAVAETYN